VSNGFGATGVMQREPQRDITPEMAALQIRYLRICPKVRTELSPLPETGRPAGRFTEPVVVPKPGVVAFETGLVGFECWSPYEPRLGIPA
jgi:hypothetical protein